MKHPGVNISHTLCRRGINRKEIDRRRQKERERSKEKEEEKKRNRKKEREIGRKTEI